MIKLQFKKTQERIYLNGILIQGKEPEVKQPNAQDLLNEISKYDFTPRRGKLSSSSPQALVYNQEVNKECLK